MNVPWRPTLRQFIEHAKSVRGIDLRSSRVIRGPRGDESFEIARVRDVDWSVILNAASPSLDDRLTPSVLRNLCRLTGIPEDDFRLDPDPDDP